MSERPDDEGSGDPPLNLLAETTATLAHPWPEAAGPRFANRVDMISPLDARPAADDRPPTTPPAETPTPNPQPAREPEPAHDPSPPTTSQGADPGLAEAVGALGERLGKRLDDLQTLFERETRAEATREKVVDRLHAELQSYKQDLLLSMLRPVFLDLIQLHDDIGKVAVASSAEAPGVDDPTEARRLVGLMEGFQQGIEDILYRQGVEPYRDEGDAFDPRRQRAVATVATDDPALAKTVAARHRMGFRAGDRVIRPEVVSVYAARKPAAP